MLRFEIVLCVCLILQKSACSFSSDDDYFVVTELYKGGKYLERHSFPYDLQERVLPIEYKNIGAPDAICSGLFIFKGNKTWKVLSENGDWNIELGRPEPITTYFPKFDSGVDAALCIKFPSSSIETIHLFKNDYYQNFTMKNGVISVESDVEIMKNFSNVDAAFLFNIVTSDTNEIIEVLAKGDKWYRFEQGFPVGGSLYHLFFNKFNKEQHFFADGIDSASHYFYL